MIPGAVSAVFTKYIVPLAFAAGLLAGGSLTWLIKSAQVAAGEVALTKCEASITKLQADSTAAALQARADADAMLDAERERIADDIYRGQAAVATEAAKLRKQLSELSLQPDYACLDRPLPDSVLERLRRTGAAHSPDPAVPPPSGGVRPDPSGRPAGW